MKKPAKNTQPNPENQPQQAVDLMKALEQSKSVNNFQTNAQFTKDLGITMLNNQLTPENIKVLEKSIKGIKDFIQILEVEIKNRSEAPK